MSSYLIPYSVRNCRGGILEEGCTSLFQKGLWCPPDGIGDMQLGLYKSGHAYVQLQLHLGIPLEILCTYPSPTAL